MRIKKTLVQMSHMALFILAGWLFFYIKTSVLISAGWGWTKCFFMKVFDGPDVRKMMFDGQESWTLKPLLSPPSNEWSVKTRTRVSQSQLRGRVETIRPRWTPCPSGVWARLPGVVSLCGCAKPGPENKTRTNGFMLVQSNPTEQCSETYW